MNKQIEPGCRARIVNSQAGNDGKIVTVLECVGDLVGFKTRFGPRWRMDTQVLTTRGGDTDHMGEGQLQRIDDDEEQEKQVTRKKPPKPGNLSLTIPSVIGSMNQLPKNNGPRKCES